MSTGILNMESLAMNKIGQLCVTGVSDYKPVSIFTLVHALDGMSLPVSHHIESKL